MNTNAEMLLREILTRLIRVETRLARLMVKNGVEPRANPPQTPPGPYPELHGEQDAQNPPVR